MGFDPTFEYKERPKRDVGFLSPLILLSRPSPSFVIKTTVTEMVENSVVSYAVSS